MSENDESKFVQMAELISRGWSDEEIVGIAGGALALCIRLFFTLKHARLQRTSYVSLRR